VDFEGNTYRLQNFIKNLKKVGKYEDTSVSPLHHAAAEGQVELMRMIISGSSCEGNRML
jgi:transient receptor potential cation channel subfamily A protein 1